MTKSSGPNSDLPYFWRPTVVPNVSDGRRAACAAVTSSCACAMRALPAAMSWLASIATWISSFKVVEWNCAHQSPSIRAPRVTRWSAGGGASPGAAGRRLDVADHEQKRDGRDREDHHELEVIDITDHGALVGNHAVERQE